MTNESIKLAYLWNELSGIKTKLDNELIPLGIYLGLEDRELLEALEAASTNIERHFTEFKLIAEAVKNLKGIKSLAKTTL